MGGIATIDTESAVLAANGAAKAVALTTASGSVESISATIELKIAQSKANSAHPLVRASSWIRGRAAARTLLRFVTYVSGSDQLDCGGRGRN